MKQKVVLKLASEDPESCSKFVRIAVCFSGNKLSLADHKSRLKALKTVVGVSGVESAALKGDDKSQIEVTGDGMDPVVLASLLRKKVGYAALVSVGPFKPKGMRLLIE